MKFELVRQFQIMNLFYNFFKIQSIEKIQSMVQEMFFLIKSILKKESIHKILFD